MTRLERPISPVDRRDDEAGGIGICQKSLASGGRNVENQ